jgi:hypothetical protein
MISLKVFKALEMLILDGAFHHEEESGFDGGENGASMETNTLANLRLVSIEAVIIDGIRPNLFGSILALAKEIRNGGFPRLKTFRTTGLGPRHPTFVFELLEDAMRKCEVSFAASKPFITFD